MRYRKNWDGMTEIVWEEVMSGNTVRKPEPAKIIQAENFRTRKGKRQRPAEEGKGAKRGKGAAGKVSDMKLLAAQSILMMTMITMICMLDAADIPQTIVLMTLIIGCSAVILLISGDEKER